ncbi:MAG TPA: porin family protein [Flavitalea sp.]|nr:porin family protein [Flavitalea sp.]
MKTVLISALLLTCISFASVAQKSYGLRAGVNFQNLNGKDASGNNLNNKMKVGFNAGITADIPVASPDYFVQTGLLFASKGAKIEGTNLKVNLNYLEVPITFLYKPILGTGKLLLGAGPYIGYALGGKVGNETISFDNDFKHFDAGGNLLFGYQFAQKLSAQLNAQLGLVNIAQHTEGDATVKNTGFGVSLGYQF